MAAPDVAPAALTGLLRRSRAWHPLPPRQIGTWAGGGAGHDPLPIGAAWGSLASRRAALSVLVVLVLPPRPPPPHRSPSRASAMATPTPEPLRGGKRSRSTIAFRLVGLVGLACSSGKAKRSARPRRRVGVGVGAVSLLLPLSRERPQTHTQTKPHTRQTASSNNTRETLSEAPVLVSPVQNPAPRAHTPFSSSSSFERDSSANMVSARIHPRSKRQPTRASERARPSGFAVSSPQPHPRARAASDEFAVAASPRARTVPLPLSLSLSPSRPLTPPLTTHQTHKQNQTHSPRSAACPSRTSATASSRSFTRPPTSTC